MAPKSPTVSRLIGKGDLQSAVMNVFKLVRFFTGRK